MRNFLAGRKARSTTTCSSRGDRCRTVSRLAIADPKRQTVNARPDVFTYAMRTRLIRKIGVGDRKRRWIGKKTEQSGPFQRLRELAAKAVQVLLVHRDHQIGIRQQFSRHSSGPMSGDIHAERIADALYLFRTAPA